MNDNSVLNINNIHFTNRELDIIACLLAGRSNKKISSILSISTKTVENHICNIMSKVGQNSREKIIDFIEQSQQFNLIKQHYLNTLKKYIFEQQLKKLLPYIKATNINCLIYYYGTQKIITSFIKQLEQYLNALKINAFCEIWKNNKLEQLINKNKKIDYIIYVISNELAEQLATGKHDIQKEIYNLIPEINNSNPIIGLLLNDTIPLELEKTSSNFITISLIEQKNLYYIVFELFKIILPIKNIDNYIVEFKKQYEILHDNYHPPIQSTQIQEKKLLETINSNIQRDIITKKNFYIFVFSIIFIVFSFISINFYKKTNSVIIKKPNTNIIQQEVLLPNQIRPMIMKLPLRNNNFIGRENYLNAIDNSLNKQKFGTIAMQVITGLSGIGKTQLATEFAYRAFESKKYDVILWITAETTDSLNDSYKTFAEDLGLDVKTLSAIEVQKLVFSTLAKKYNKSRILFVFDNVVKEQNIKNHLKILHEQSINYFTPYVLITSRSQCWSEVTYLILEHFTKNESITFVKAFLPNETDQSALKLSQLLNYYPLALNHAISYIITHTNLNDYLNICQKRTYIYHFSDENINSIKKTWEITLSKLTKNSKKILFTSVFLDPDNISIDLFEDLTFEEKMAAIEVLQQHSLIILNNNKTFRIHRALQKIIKSTMTKENYWLNYAISLIEKKFSFDYLNVNKWETFEQYLTNAFSISQHAINNQHFLYKGIKLHAQIAMFKTHVLIGGEDVIDIWLKLIELVKTNYNQNNNQLFLASIHAHLSVVYRIANNIKAAESCAELANKTYRNINSIKITKQEFTLLNILRLIPLNCMCSIENIRYDFGYSLTQFGNIYNYSLHDYKKAILFYQQALDTFATIKNVHHAKYHQVDTLYNIGTAYIHIGNLNVAETLLQEAKQLIDEIYPNHRQQACAYIRLADFYSNIGEFKKADELYQTAWKIFSTIISEKHIHMITLKNILGFNALMSGNTNAAKTFLATTIPYDVNESEVITNNYR